MLCELQTWKIMPPPIVKSSITQINSFIFASRWLQLPLYLGLIAAQAVYVFHFWVELVHLLEAAFGSQTALQALIGSIGYKTDAPITGLNEVVIMLVVLGLIDVVMISNLLIMVIVGGYETFVSRLNLDGHPDQPNYTEQVLMWQTIIHIAFLFSAIAIAYADRLMSHHHKAH
jgi:uncharacterized membrane protein YqhA